MPSTTWPPAPTSCGGTFDYDAKKSRLVEVARTLEDPNIWSDAKRAQDLGRERRTLEETVGTLEQIDSSLKDSAELFTLAKGEADDATLSSIDADAKGVEKMWSEYQKAKDKPETLNEEMEMFRMLFRSAKAYDLNTVLQNDPAVTSRMEAVNKTMKIIVGALENEKQDFRYTIKDYSKLTGKS